MLAHLDVLLAQRPPIQAQLVKLAAWFHDVVYTLGPPRQDYSDEQASADFARRTMWVLGAPADHRHEVSRLVLSTRDHDPDPADISASALSDADLAILGAPWPAYTRYASNIRTEYSWVSEADYRSGRIGVLEGILAKDTVYKLPLTVTLYESTARANVAREIAELRI
jgi:predicted metal-dependent HD superfamily phosphohydrolase